MQRRGVLKGGATHVMNFALFRENAESPGDFLTTFSFHEHQTGQIDFRRWPQSVPPVFRLMRLFQQRLAT